MDDTLLLRIAYAATIATGGMVGLICLFFPTLGSRIGYERLAEPSPAIRVSGAFWVALAVLCAVGLWHPRAMVLVLVVELLYKGLWLVVDPLPKLLQKRGSEVPVVMTTLFVVFVVALPFIIPWGRVLGNV